MGKHRKLLLKILQGEADANIPIKGLCQLVVKLGFEERVRGGHHIFRRSGVEELVNLQEDGVNA